MVGIVFLVILLVGFVIVVLVVAAVADWVLGLSNLNPPRAEDESERREPAVDGFTPSFGSQIGGICDAGAGVVSGGCDAGAAGGCDGGAAVGGGC